MDAEEHRRNAHRIRDAYTKLKQPSGFDHLLPRLAEIHEELAEEAEGRVTPDPISTDSEVVRWADGVCRRLIGIKPRPRVITHWDTWAKRMREGGLS
jgi:hypothetical protein